MPAWARPNHIVAILLAGIGVAGVMGQILEDASLPSLLAFPSGAVLTILPLAIIARHSVVSGAPTRQRLRSPAVLSLFSLSIISAAGLLWSAWGYSGRTGYLVSLFPQFEKEDNAKWVNVVSDFADGGSAGFDLVGGAVSAYLFVAHLTSTVLSSLTGQVTATVGSSVLAVAIAQWSLVLGAPLALAPVFRRTAVEQQPPLDLTAAAVFSAMILTTGSFMAATFGHLTAQMVIVGLAFVGARAVSTTDWTGSDGALTRVIALLVLSTWLPLQPLALVGALLTVVRCGRSVVRRSGSMQLQLAEGWLSLVIGVSVIPSIRFIAESELGDELAAAGGATNSAHPSLLIAFGVVTALSAALLKVRDDRGAWVLVVGLITLSLYSLVLRFNDFRVTGTLNYGSTKFMWVVAVSGVSIGVLALARTAAIPALSGSPVKVGGALVLLLIPSLGSTEHLMQWSKQFDAERWGQPAEGRWYSAGALPMSTPIHDVAVGCVVKAFVDAPVPPSYTLDSYLCSRFLASAAGLEEAMSPLVRFGLGRLGWEGVADELDIGMVGDRTVLVLDQNSTVIGEASMGQLIEWSQQMSDLTVSIVPAFGLDLPAGNAAATVEAVDQVSGQVSGWVTPAVTTLEVLVENPVDTPTFVTPRLPRPDVAAALGPTGLYSGFSFFVDTTVFSEVLCIRAVSASTTEVVFSRDGMC